MDNLTPAKTRQFPMEHGVSRPFFDPGHGEHIHKCSVAKRASPVNASPPHTRLVEQDGKLLMTPGH
jgi:hypothetical protein